ncbi:MAG: DUF1844 domain-containing protein [Candidatus Omnitrophota bacterium]
MDEKEKSIDESWKETVAKEKKSLKDGEGFIPPEPDFSFFITTLSLQASIALGKIPNPGTNQKEDNPEQAKFIIDTLAMLKEKTKGNLNKEEDGLLDNLLYELRMEYVSLSKERPK